MPGLRSLPQANSRWSFVNPAKAQLQFPDPRSAGEDGLLCVGGNLEVNTLASAYSQGIFPWPQEGLPLLWFSPERRGVLDFANLHWSRRFLRALKGAVAERFQLTFNRAFLDVINACASVPRAHESGTWILTPMRKAYLEFHEAGYAHSVECWQDGELVGGLYGVYIGGVFSGESMFYRVSDASKLCLYALIQRLQHVGLTWMDIQMVTPVLETLGGHYIAREDYLQRLEQAKRALPKQIELQGEFAWSSK